MYQAAGNDQEELLVSPGFGGDKHKKQKHNYRNAEGKGINQRIAKGF